MDVGTLALSLLDLEIPQPIHLGGLGVSLRLQGGERPRVEVGEGGCLGLISDWVGLEWLVNPCCLRRLHFVGSIGFLAEGFVDTVLGKRRGRILSAKDGRGKIKLRIRLFGVV